MCHTWYILVLNYHTGKTLNNGGTIWRNESQFDNNEYSGSHFSRIFPHSDCIWRDTEYLSVFSRNAAECEKNVDQNNFEYGHFLRSEYTIRFTQQWKQLSARTVCHNLRNLLCTLILLSIVLGWHIFEVISLAQVFLLLLNHLNLKLNCLG